MRIIRKLAGIFAIVSLAMQTHAQSFLTNGLVAYYPFDGNANDASGNGNNGTLFGSAALGADRFGNSNACLALPGTAGVGSGVDIPSLSGAPYQPVTYSVWFLLNNYLPSGDGVMSLVGREQCGDINDGGVLSGSAWRLAIGARSL
jgi:hypothetical protein